MTAFNIIALFDIIGFQVIKMLISIFWQSSILFCVLALSMIVLRRNKAAVRHFFWASLLCMIPIIPLFVWLFSVTGTTRSEIPVLPSYSPPAVSIIEKPIEEASVVDSDEKNDASSIFRINPTDYPWAFVFFGYIICVMFFLSVVVIGRIKIRNMIYHGKVVTDRRTLHVLQGARTHLGVKRSFVVVEHEDIQSPFIARTLHPVLLLPTNLKDHLSDYELKALAYHEYAHVKRNDVLILSFISILRAIFFFHPLVWIAAHNVATLAEDACDDTVIDFTEDTIEYAEMLTKIAVEIQKRFFSEELAAGFIFSKHILLRRIEKILSDRKNHLLTLSKPVLSGILSVIGITLMFMFLVPFSEISESSNRGLKNIPQMDKSDDTITEFIGGKIQKIDPHELAGIIYNENGHPIEGVFVDAWTWHSKAGHEAYTDTHGRFRLTNLSRDSKVEVRFSKDGYSPELVLKQQTGIGNIIVRMNDNTFLEGKVFAPDGTPVQDALIRANQGPKQAQGVIITNIWTETRSKQDGSYRLYLEPDTYDIQVRTPGKGVARYQNETIEQDKTRRFDISLERGVAFRANIVESQTKRPLQNVKLWHWQHEGIEGISNEDGIIEIMDMFPGPFEFQVEADGYTRWWSEDAVHKHHRKMISNNGWQRNFDDILFDLTNGMNPVEIVIEKGATITGHVFDPNGNPVPGATVAPARTGTGNSLTGDTRFSFQTEKDGSYEMLLPASGESEYNLIAHDGKYGEWRDWANGVSETLSTLPGSVLQNVDLYLTRPATVKGHVEDENGNPLANHHVYARPVDLRNNRYYDPKAETDDQGNFIINFIRPGENYIQADPIFLHAEETPEWANETVTLKSGEILDGIKLIGNKRPERK